MLFLTFATTRQIIDILFEKIGDNAHKMILDYIGNDFIGDILNIQPGNYTLYFHGDYQKFNKMSGNQDNILKLFEFKNENNI